MGELANTFLTGWVKALLQCNLDKTATLLESYPVVDLRIELNGVELEAAPAVSMLESALTAPLAEQEIVAAQAQAVGAAQLRQCETRVQELSRDNERLELELAALRLPATAPAPAPAEDPVMVSVSQGALRSVLREMGRLHVQVGALSNQYVLRTAVIEALARRNEAAERSIEELYCVAPVSLAMSYSVTDALLQLGRALPGGDQ